MCQAGVAGEETAAGASDAQGGSREMANPWEAMMVQ